MERGRLDTHRARLGVRHGRCDSARRVTNGKEQKVETRVSYICPGPIRSSHNTKGQVAELQVEQIHLVLLIGEVENRDNGNNAPSCHRPE